MMKFNDYVEFCNESKEYWLGIGKIVGTKDLYITLFTYITIPHSSPLDEVKDTEGSVKRFTLQTKIMKGGEYDVSNDESIDIKDRYIKMLAGQYKPLF